MPSIRDEFGRILDLRWSLARDQCASQPICALRVGPNRGKTPKSCSFKNEGIPEAAIPPLRSVDGRQNEYGTGTRAAWPRGFSRAHARRSRSLKNPQFLGKSRFVKNLELCNAVTNALREAVIENEF